MTNLNYFLTISTKTYGASVVQQVKCWPAELAVPGLRPSGDGKLSIYTQALRLYNFLMLN